MTSVDFDQPHDAVHTGTYKSRHIVAVCVKQVNGFGPNLKMSCMTFGGTGKRKRGNFYTGTFLGLGVPLGQLSECWGQVVAPGQFVAAPTDITLSQQFCADYIQVRNDFLSKLRAEAATIGSTDINSVPASTKEPWAKESLLKLSELGHSEIVRSFGEKTDAASPIRYFGAFQAMGLSVSAFQKQFPNSAQAPTTQPPAQTQPQTQPQTIPSPTTRSGRATQNALESYPLKPGMSPDEIKKNFSLDIRAGWKATSVLEVSNHFSDHNGILDVSEFAKNQAGMDLRAELDAENALRKTQGKKPLDSKEKLARMEQQAAQEDSIKRAEADLERINLRLPDGDDDNKTWNLENSARVFLEGLRQKYGADLVDSYSPKGAKTSMEIVIAIDAKVNPR